MHKFILAIHMALAKNNFILFFKICISEACSFTLRENSQEKAGEESTSSCD